jgi:ATP-binding cassette subfamily F protein 3
MIVISHDREFLDAITNVTLHLTTRSSRATAATTARLKTLRAEQMALQQQAFPSSRTRSPTCRSSSTASRPRPARPSRRKAASRRWSAWKSWRRCWPSADFSSSSGAGQPAQPHAGDHRCRALASDGGRRGATAQGSSCAGVNRIQRAGRPAHRHPGRQRPGQVHAGQDHCPRNGAAGRHRHRGQGPGIGYFAQQELDVLRPAGQPAGAHGAPGARGGPPRRASRSCATSWAASASAATWSSRPWAP